MFRSRSSFDSGFGWFKLVFGFIVCLIAAAFIMRIVLINNAVSEGKSVYEIKVNTFNEYETYITNKYVKDKESGCITFKDEFGFKRTVCNNYTITQY